MTEAAPTPQAEAAHDRAELASLGYRQELDRRLSTFSNFAISFSIICVLSGGVNSLAQVTSGAGGAGVGIGWLMGCAVSGVFALAMAQLASSFPTAGGLYHWASILGNRGAGWLTAWLNLLGLVTSLASINVGGYTFFVAAFGLQPSLATEFVYLAAVGTAMAVFNHLGIRLTAILTDLSGYLIIGTVVLLTATCLVFARHLDFGRLFTYHNYSGAAGGGVWPRVSNTWVFLLGMLMPIFTITGYDASAHTAEETRDAAIAVPRGIVRAVLYSTLAGYILVCSMVLLLPDMDEAAKQGWNVFFWAMAHSVPAALRLLLYALIFAAQLLCGLATVTSTSRMIFAFARDGGLPFSGALARVDPHFKTPVAAIWTASILAFAFVIGTTSVSVAGTSAYAVAVSCNVIFLFLSFAIPVVFGAFAWGTPRWQHIGPWNLGRVRYTIVAGLCVLAMILIFSIGIQPPNQAALPITMGFLLMALIAWFALEKKRFRGPPILYARQTPGAA